MTDRLSEADLTRMRAEHVRDSTPVIGVGDQVYLCRSPLCQGQRVSAIWPCDAARLLAHFAPGPVPHLAGIVAGLFGPVSTEELSR
jgi:hypothetical protein